MISVIYLLISWCFSEPLLNVAPATPEHMSILMEVEEKYQKAPSVSMVVQKSDKLEALDQTRKFNGTLKIKKEKFRLELVTDDSGNDKSMIIADGKNVFLVTLPPQGFEGAKTQVMKVSIKNPKASSLGIQMLVEAGILKHFTVTGVANKPELITYFLQPKKTSQDFKRAQVIVNKKLQTIEQFSYWDQLSNQVNYVFSQVDFKQLIDDSLLSYTPPKDADVMTY